METATLEYLNLSLNSSLNGTMSKNTSEAITDYSYVFCLYTSGSRLERLLLKILTCYMNPLLAILGFGANMISIEILRRSGLRKPSNIFLLSLVVADSMNQLQSMNYGEIFLFWGPDLKNTELCGWQYSDAVEYFLFASIVVFYFFGCVGSYVNTLLPVIITMERLLAVFLPLTFKKLVTTKTATVVAVLAYAVWLPWVLTFSNLYQFYRFPLSGSEHYSIVALGRKYHKEEALYDLLNHFVFPILSSWVPVTLVSLGSTVIWIKLVITVRLRKKMSSEKAKIHWSPRTTRTLLATCLIFTVTNITLAFLNVFILSSYKFDIKFFIATEMSYFVTLINTSSNFFVYITSNRKLLDIFVDIIRCQ